MSGLSGLRIVVAGAGATGSAVAWRLRDLGANVVLADPAPLADNASGVAAGMLAPAFEALLDEASLGRYGLLKAARDAWPGFAESLAPFGARLHRCGALWVGDEQSTAEVRQGLVGMGAEAERLPAAEAEALSPGLAAPAGAVLTPEDWRLDPAEMLRALHTAFLARGGEVRAAGLGRIEPGRVVLSDGVSPLADVVVLATGLAPAGMAAAPPETGYLSPIKGQILRSRSRLARAGPIVRAEGVYVAPSQAGAAIGATMQPGLEDRRIEPEALEPLGLRARRLFPDLARAGTCASAGVRASSPDGLPLVGPSSVPGLWLALGARRNGWLLAPLVSQILADALEGKAPGPWSAAFDPLRFGSAIRRA